jgi:hypothetical protein
MSSIALLLLLTLLYPTLGAEDEPTIKLSLMSNYQADQPADSYAYYSLTFNTTKRLLLLTLDSNSTSYTSLFLSLHFKDSDSPYYSHPNETHSTQECDQSSF